MKWYLGHGVCESTAQSLNGKLPTFLDGTDFFICVLFG